ncbi:MAG TPA: hypothetical protein DHL02_15400 [Achromobacter sp.]|nr:hypothetical protein [Achromobacter sp.]
MPDDQRSTGLGGPPFLRPRGRAQGQARGRQRCHQHSHGHAARAATAQCRRLPIFQPLLHYCPHEACS